jgi:hypothetical protein
MNRKYAIFSIKGNGQGNVEKAVGFTEFHEWLPDVKFDSIDEATLALSKAYDLDTNEFVVLEVISNANQS